jgi:hypothetical protein
MQEGSMHTLARIAPLLLLLLGLIHPAAANDAIGLAPGQRLLPPITYRQLAIFPVIQTSAAIDKTQYLTLSEGLARKLVTVTELGNGGSVNTLAVHNASDKPLLMLGGEVVLGGQQDRVLGQDTIVPAREKMQVQVFCVEHGRWAGGQRFDAAEGMADTKIRVRAKYRVDQSAVWDEVAKKNAVHGVSASTGTYRNLASGNEGKRALTPYREAIGGALVKLPAASQVVGVVAAVNGRVTSVEIFSRPELFAAYRDKLLDSIYMGASDVAPVAGAAPPDESVIGEFLKAAKQAPQRTVGKTSAGTTVERRAKGVVNSTVRTPLPAAPPVYESYQADE